MIAEQLNESSPFRAETEAILSRELSPDNIDTYASEALNNYIGVIERAKQAYVEAPTQQFLTDKETEDAALSYWGIHDVDATLDHLSEKADEIERLNQVIADAELSPHVFVPPGTTKTRIEIGEIKPFDEKGQIPRLKTILFILENEFGLDVRDKSQVHITKGRVDEKMMRKTSYYTLNIPSLSRLVLVCDEEENATFVFDSALLEKYGLHSEVVSTFDKPQIESLIDQTDRIGVRYIYTQDYTAQTISVLERIPERGETFDRSAQRYSYLFPDIPKPENTFAARNIADLHGVNKKNVAYAIELLGDALSPYAHTYRSRGRETTAYDSDGVELILGKLHERGEFLPVAPEDVLSVRGLAQRIKVRKDDVAAAVYDPELAEKLGELKKYKTGPKRTVGLDERQQRVILDELTRRGKYAPDAPEGAVSRLQLVRKYDVVPAVVDAVFEEIADELGELQSFRFGAIKDTGLTREQAQVFDRYVSENNRIVPKATKEEVSAKAIARATGETQYRVEKAIAELSAILGDVPVKRFGPNKGPAYDPLRRRIIEEHLRASRAAAQHAQVQ